jgi:hypothetical protein
MAEKVSGHEKGFFKPELNFADIFLRKTELFGQFPHTDLHDRQIGSSIGKIHLERFIFFHIKSSAAAQTVIKRLNLNIIS